MKLHYFKTVLLLVVLFSTSISVSQTVYTEKYPKWRLGLNMGGTWQTNDILKNKAGLAGGFNIERILNKKDDALLGFSLGFRYFGGNSYGYDNRKNTALKSNTALNGTNDSLLNYYKAPGYFYNNYKTKLNEGALELKINFPKFEKRTNVVFHVFGGIGLSTYAAKVNALNGDTMYNYSKFNGKDPSLNDVKAFYDKSYETVADNNSSKGTSVWAPSVGLGLGYRFSKNVALVFEHRITFPGVDDIDGQRWSGDYTTTPQNDYYHYTAAHLIFTIYGKSHKNHSSTNNTNTNTQTNINNYSSPKPIINVYTPVTNPYTTASNVQQVSGSIKHLTSASGISINVNGSSVSSFDFNPNNGAFSFNTNLISGLNNISITATNSSGQDNETIQINYNPFQTVTQPVATQPVITEQPPKVLITYPANNNVSSQASTNVTAMISNISSSSNIALAVNGVALTNFNYNSFSGALNFVAPLQAGNNSIIVSAFNSAGNDAQQVYVKYVPKTNVQVVIPQTEPLPTVSFHNPSHSPFTSASKNFNITALVTNVTSANQIAVTYNGNPVTNFTFNSYGFVNFTALLNQGSNTVIITGTNTAGSATKSATINYTEMGNPPVVTIVSPSQNPLTTNDGSTSVSAKIENVQNQSNINVLVNNAVVPFIFNTANNTVTIQTALDLGTNTITITATNNFGTDTKKQIIERTIPVVKKPMVTIISPAVNPYNSAVPTQQVAAHVLNVNSASQIKVTNTANTIVPFNYDLVLQQITFTANLNNGSNTFSVSATNSAGTDSKSLTINYIPKSTPVVVKPPVISIVNPASNPFTTFDATMDVLATALNVNTQQEITVTLNGNPTNFTFNSTTKEVLIPVSLQTGNNTVDITASNLGGSDSKTEIITRKEITRCLLFPIVNIINPQDNPFTTHTASANVLAEVLNVSGASNIQVVNQQNQTINFNYDNTTHYVSFSANLNSGSNVYKIKGTNNVGSDEEAVTINYVKTLTVTQNPIKVNKPIVTITTPSSVNTNILMPTQVISATITNITSASDVSVLVNGQTYTNFTYTNGVVGFTLNCIDGTNSVTITGTNSAGSDVKTIYVKYQKPAPVIPPPLVTFVSPGTLNTVTTNASAAISATVLNVTSASQVLVNVNGATINNFTYNAGTVTFTANLNAGSNTVMVKGSNASGVDSKTISIVYERPVVINPPVVSYIIPASANITTNSQTETIKMSVTNVTSASQINVKVNGINFTHFTYNTGIVTFNATFALGANTVLVTATNSGGSDSKQVNVNYELPPIPKPVVTILNPNPNTTVTVSAQTVEASISNIATASQVQVTLNNTPVSSFNFMNGNITFIANLTTGLNTITVTGTNASGSDSKSVTITYNAPVRPIDPPVVTFLNPSQATSTVAVASQNISATVTNVNASQVSVKLNGNPITNFTYSNATVNFIAQLNPGSNTIVVSGTNTSGSDSKTITINYNEPAPVVTPPVVTITNPSSANTTTQNNVQNVTATVTNVNSASQITVLVNNTPISNFTYSNGNVSFVSALVIGSNTIKITGTNTGGSDSKTVTITRQAPPAPSVTITNPNVNPFMSGSANITVTATVANVAYASEITVTTGGTSIPFNYDVTSDVLTFNYTLTGNTTFLINASNANGSDSKSLTVKYTVPVADPDIVICHYPPGNTNNPQQITIPQSAWPAHQAHGDVLGGCPASNTGNGNNNGGNNNSNGNNNSGGNTTSDPDVVICHYPPGNTNNSQQITIPQSAWPAHQAHGDVLGGCPATTNGNNSNNNGNNNSSGNNNGNSNSGGNNNSSGNNNGGGNGKTITICHYPPGNTNNPQQLIIPEASWPAHQAHGDTKGACPASQSTNGNNNGSNNNGGTIINGIKGLITPKTNNSGGGTTTPTNTTTPKANTEPKNETPKTNTPRVIQPTGGTTTPKTENPETPKSTPPPTTPSGNTGESAPRTIKPR